MALISWPKINNCIWWIWSKLFRWISSSECYISDFENLTCHPQWSVVRWTQVNRMNLSSLGLPVSLLSSWMVALNNKLALYSHARVSSVSVSSGGSNPPVWSHCPLQLFCNTLFWKLTIDSSQLYKILISESISLKRVKC